MSLDELKEMQKIIIKKNRIINMIAIAVLLLIAYFIYFTGLFNTMVQRYPAGIFFLAILYFILYYFIRNAILNKEIKTFNKGYKNIFVLSSLKKIFTDLKYEYDKGFSYDEIASTQMMNMGDRYTSNDYFEAKYKGINVRQADIHIEEERQTTDSDGNTHTYWVTLFLGKWMVFDFNKTFKANLQLCQKGFYNNRVSRWGNSKYQKVQMEDEAFNKLFVTNAQSEHEAFYILTPPLMEKIKKLSSEVNGKLLLCFINNELHVGLANNKDSFEHNVFKKIDEEKAINEISKDIKIITSFIDELNLDNDLFRKEV